MQSPFQLLLDLFDEARPAPIAVRPAPTVLTQDVEPSPGEPLAGLLAPQAFRHPDANREARLGEVLVAYEFRRARRKNIGFAVGPEGLVVSAPRWVPLYEVEQALRAKSRWIVNKLEAARERQERLETARITWRDGASFPYLGEPVILVLDPRHDFRESGGVLHTDSSTLPGVARQTLHIGLPHTANEAQIRDSVQAWLMRQAKALFVERLNHYAPRLNVQWRKLSLSSAGTLWGTARTDGSIRLNWRLVHFRLPVIDYVVAHELSHLRVMDHSPRFWETVKTVVPNYSELRGQLKDEALPVWS
ncbi:M48 family metallopeptidase [Ramlibacter ginsenosidimutans]|uniref:M48 family metallopeptidase n=1 Tax=Ramlibacter ginsenosidimutans TaxID=502333 RepID=A0A934TRN1_9BURK|nr:SprT family zinc-dependent metalloprotease [Ramlibacter ginsenosidimutans]MBK6006203.1 M48 family metallopeptidase [Ramlibacter ginsenosidimutans]